MRVTLYVQLALVAGCGRLDIDPITAGDGGPTDTPALPASLVCGAHVFGVSSVGADTDLAAVHNGSGFLAVWAEPGVPATGIAIDLNFQATTMATMPTAAVDGIGGLVVTPSTTLLVTRASGTQTIWSMPSNQHATMLASESRVTGRDPFVADAGTLMPRAWIRADATGLHASYITDDGTLGVTNDLPTAAPVVAFSAADNFGHGHITWAQAGGGAAPSTCTQADIRFDDPQRPTLSVPVQISSDCSNPRITSGPEGTDSIFTAWAESTGEIDIRYLGAVPDLGRTLSLSGRAPKVAFDGTTFWVSWMEHQATGDVIRLANVRTDGTSRAVDLPGWLPASDESFELIRRGGSVYLFVLGRDTLALLETCA